MAYNPEEDIKVSDLPEKTTDVVSDDKLLVIDSEDANILKQVDASKVGGGGSGTGDMLKSVYDKNNDGVVDDAEALGGFPASDYAKSADVQPTLESGVNIKTINGNSILGPGNIEIQGGTGTVDTEMSDTSTNAVQNKVIKGYVDTSAGTKQDTLVSGTNIKTINNQSLLGNGNIDVSGGSGTVDTAMSDSSTNAVQNKVITEYITPRSTGYFSVNYTEQTQIYAPNPNYYLPTPTGPKGFVIHYVATVTRTDNSEKKTVSGVGIATYSNYGASDDIFAGQVVTNRSKEKFFCQYYGLNGEVTFFTDCIAYFDFGGFLNVGTRKYMMEDTQSITDRMIWFRKYEGTWSGTISGGSMRISYNVQVFY